MDHRKELSEMKSSILILSSVPTSPGSSPPPYLTNLIFFFSHTLKQKTKSQNKQKPVRQIKNEHTFKDNKIQSPFVVANSFTSTAPDAETGGSL